MAEFNPAYLLSSLWYLSLCECCIHSQSLTTQCQSKCYLWQTRLGLENLLILWSLEKLSKFPVPTSMLETSYGWYQFRCSRNWY